MNKRACFVTILLMAAALLSGCSAAANLVEPMDPSPIAFVSDGSIAADFSATGDDVPISRALVAKMIALTFANPATINQTPKAINFADTNDGLWYDKYINMAVSLGKLSGVGDRFFPEDHLTLEHAQSILDRLDPSNEIRIQLTDDNRHLAISYALWVSLYTQMLENISAGRGFEYFGITQERAVVLITPEFNSALPNGHVITNLGHFTTAGLSLNEFLDQEISFLHRDGEIFAILGVSEVAPTLHNVYIAQRTADSITIFVGGAQRTYAFDAAALPPGNIADVRINGRNAEAVRIFGQSISGIVKQADEILIEIEGIGRIDVHDVFGIYNTIGAVTLGNFEQITIGYDVAEFVLRDGKITAAIIQRRPTPEHIRVVLSTTGFASRVHNDVQLRSAAGFVIRADQNVVEVPPNQIFTLSQNTEIIAQGRLILIPNDGGKIEILSIQRAWPDGASPQYRGILEITTRGSGFVVVNELPLEQYIYAVIPSEMPASFGLEAAKVQAITARSYAYNQFFANRFYEYGANVDDSVMSQVYNNFPETDVAINAADATRGMYLTHAGGVVSANFFSTSSGHTANSGDVWINSTWQFDAFTPPYLAAQLQYFSGDFGNLSYEDNARRFFTDTDVQAFDADSPWFRWNLELTNQQLTDIIAANLSRLTLDNPHLFVRPDSDEFPPLFVTNIGDFRHMEVISRGVGGNIRELLITGSADSVLVRTEYAIRRLLAPRHADGIQLFRHSSAPVTNHFILPSTFMTFEAANDGLRIYGGGFGHGVGMSQHGVFGMTQLGYNFEEILMHFYPGTLVMQLNIH